jgi:putative transposase
MMQPGGQSSLTIESACEAAQVSRVGFYRHYQEHAPRQAETQLRDSIQRIALAHRCYGYRRVVAELRKEGLVVNQKRARRILREDNLLSLRRRRYVLSTDSRHPYWIYPNAAAKLEVNAINQLWVADLTYIRLREQFLYLAVILDAHSRRVVGWKLGETLEATLALSALDRALAERAVPAGIVHHSDRGIQYCSHEYIQRLEENHFQISMSRKGNPYDNAKAESFMKTLKCEEVYLHQYRDLHDARESIERFLDEVYNRERLHSALGYLSPVEFEAALEDKCR